MNHYVVFEYDLAGRMTSKTDQRAVVTTFGYDDRGLLTQRSATLDSVTTVDTYRYDGLGRMTGGVRIVGGSEVSSNGFAYDPLSRLTVDGQQLFGGSQHTGDGLGSERGRIGVDGLGSERI